MHAYLSSIEKPDPTSVTNVPPVSGPWQGNKASTVGTDLSSNRTLSSSKSTPLFDTPTVRISLILPSLIAGTTHLSNEDEIKPVSKQKLFPNLATAPSTNPVPTIVTVKWPSIDPEDGSMPVTSGPGVYA
jgi:hypothetical protein